MKLIFHFILVLLAAQSRSETVQSEDAQVKWTSSEQDSQPSLPEQLTDKEDITDIESVLEQDRSLRRSSNKNLTIDLLIIIDNSMYTRWLKWSGNDYYACVKKIEPYLASIFDGVNKIYTSLPSYQITFKVVQMYIAKASSQSNYLEDSVAKQYEDKAKRNFTAALPGFSEWVNKHEIGKGKASTERFLKQHDLAIAFTDYSEDHVGGAAGLGVICSNYSQSIVHATDLSLTITATAHEIGHALGSRDDGDGNQCDSGYLMSGASTDKDITNWNKFSTCSIEQIKNKIKALKRSGQNCLDPSKTQREHFEFETSSNLGVHLGADMQCGLRYGRGYKFCSQGLNTGSTMCNKMMCLHMENKTCHGNGTFQTALDGTTCGKGKWCMNGQCVTGAQIKPEEKDKKESCYFGDYSSAFLVNLKLTECKDFKEKPSLCYTNKLKALCCDTCEKMKLELNKNAQVKWTYSASSDQDSQPSLPEQKTGKGDITDIANDVVEMDPKSETNTAEKVRDLEQDRSLRRRRSSKKNLIMDLLVIIDNSMYTRWLEWSGHNSYTCLNKIKHYLASIIDGVNNIYSSLPSYQITFKVVQIYLSEASSQSNYLEDSVAKQYEDKTKRNFEAALPGFSEWVNKHEIGKGKASSEKFLKQHDLAIAFTDYSEDPVGGAAGLGVICSNYSQSIVHATDLSLTIATTAHEIGHALGSRHDGDGNKCDSGYLMSKASTDKDIKNLKKFSTCSIEQIENKIKALERAGQNCMDPSKKQREHLELGTYLSSNLGVHLEADMQCGLRFGKGYKFCSQGLSTSSTMCNEMMCLHMEKKTCHKYQAFSAALDGTTCGKGKWCMKGQCVTGAQIKPEEKVKKESCYFGDIPSVFIFNNKRKECKDFPENPSLCNDSQLKALCCDTCEKIKLHPSRESCIDKIGETYKGEQIDCNTLHQKTHLCYHIYGICCKTCSEIKTKKVAKLGNKKGCEYGDITMKRKIDNEKRDCSYAFMKLDICNDSFNSYSCCESCFDAEQKSKKLN